MELLYVFLINLGVSFVISIWIIFDAKSRAMKSYTLQGVIVFLFGIIGLWLPYLLYYFIFRPQGKLIWCPEDKHKMLEWLPACPYCDPRLTWTEKKKAAKPELWDAFDNISLLAAKIQKASAETRAAETNAWFKRLAHYQDAFSRYFLYGMLIVFFLSFNLMAIIFFMRDFSFGIGLPMIMIIVLFGYLGISVFQLLYLIQAEIMRVKIVISTMIDERAESIKLADKRGMISYSAMTLQVALGIILALNFYMTVIRYPDIQNLVITYGTTGFLSFFIRALFIGIAFGCYISISLVVKTQMEQKQMAELYSFLKKMVPSEKIGGTVAKEKKGITDKSKKRIRKVKTSEIIEEAKTAVKKTTPKAKTARKKTARTAKKTK